MKNILVIEDDPTLIELLEIHLKDIHCDVTKAITGTKGLALATENRYELIILDLSLPEINGLEICKKLRENKILTPIMMLTARSEEIDKIIGLESGADDYLTKPFSIREFIARVKAILRRKEMGFVEKNVANDILNFGNLVLDPTKRKVILADQRVELTPKEFDLLHLFMANPGKNYSRENLLNLVWGYEFAGYEHTVNSHINRLRAKIEQNLQKPQYILTNWGQGYHFNEEAPTDRI